MCIFLKRIKFIFLITSCQFFKPFQNVFLTVMIHLNNGLKYSKESCSEIKGGIQNLKWKHCLGHTTSCMKWFFFLPLI